MKPENTKVPFAQLWPVIIGILLCTVTLLIVFSYEKGQRTELRVADNAKRENTVPAYHSYLSSYPNGAYRGEIQRALYALEYKEYNKQAALIMARVNQCQQLFNGYMRILLSSSAAMQEDLLAYRDDMEAHGVFTKFDESNIQLDGFLHAREVEPGFIEVHALLEELYQAYKKLYGLVVVIPSSMEEFRDSFVMHFDRINQLRLLVSTEILKGKEKDVAARVQESLKKKRE
jgi:hypothetical protein